MKEKIKPILPYIEIPIVKHCNLKCKCCSHLSNVERECFLDIGEFEKGILRLSSLFENIEVIRLLGGEPLLHPEIVSFVKLTRKTFPKSEIKLVTNGLPIINLDDSVILSLAGEGAIFDISQYAPTSKIKDKLISKLRQNKALFYLSEPITEFRKRLLSEPLSDAKTAWESCGSKNCYILCGEYISYCCLAQLQDAAEEYFDFKMDMSESKLNIFDADLDGARVIEFLSSPHSCCSYCGVPETVTWSVSKKATLSDWTVDKPIKRQDQK